MKWNYLNHFLYCGFLDMHVARVTTGVGFRHLVLLGLISTLLPTLTMLVGMGRTFEAVCLFVLFSAA